MITHTDPLRRRRIQNRWSGCCEVPPCLARHALQALGALRGAVLHQVRHSPGPAAASTSLIARTAPVYPHTLTSPHPPPLSYTSSPCQLNAHDRHITECQVTQETRARNMANDVTTSICRALCSPCDRMTSTPRNEGLERDERRGRYHSIIHHALPHPERGEKTSCPEGTSDSTSLRGCRRRTGSR